MDRSQVETINQIVDRAYFQALMMIHRANNRPQTEKGEPKVGGHPSACASSKHILGALHLVCRQPEDYFAHKPHVSPMDHAYNFLLHNFAEKDDSWMSSDKRKLAMNHLRHFSREGHPVFQSYHAEADPDSFRFFPSGSVGIPPVNSLYTALGYDYAKDHGFKIDEDPIFWCLMGDSEFREGSLAEAMPDGGERQLKKVVWIIDYNRQNLDGTRVTNEEAMGGSDADRMYRMAEANGWRAEILKHGKKREKFFAQKGGEELKEVFDQLLSDFEFQGLIEADDAELTKKVFFEKSSQLKKNFGEVSAIEFHELLFNLGGHDIEVLVEAFERAKKSDKPSFLIPYTIKGHSLACQALSGNHSALPSEAELKEKAEKLGMSFDEPFDDELKHESNLHKFLVERRKTLLPGIEKIKKAVRERRQKYDDLVAGIDFPKDFNITTLKLSPYAHTQWMWGQVAAKLDRLARGADERKLTDTETKWVDAAQFFLTMAPDVGTSTNTSPNMNGKLYGDIGQEDVQAEFGTKDKKAPDIVPNTTERTGHLRFEIAESNCMSAVGSMGKLGDLLGIPFFPAMTIYDFFIKRAHDQYYYNVYWKSSFLVVGTPAGVTLAPEGAQHSWKSDFQMPHSITWEPAFAKEVDWILADTLSRHFRRDNKDREGVLLRGKTKGLEQKLFLKSLKEQERFEGVADEQILESIREDVLKGGYCLLSHEGHEDYTPGDNVIHLFAMGALVLEALRASEKLREKGIFANVFVVTSPDLLLGNLAYENNYEHLRQGLGVNGDLHFRPDRGHQVGNLSDWHALKGSRIPILSVHDGEAGLLDNIGSIVGVYHHTVAVRKASKSGTTTDVFHYHRMDHESLAQAAEEVLQKTAHEQVRVSSEVLSQLS